MQDTFDYIVVGGGSAGCVVANRLSADPSLRVLLLEAGPEPRSPWIKMPGGVAKLYAPGPHNYGYATAPEPHLNNRQIYWPRGRGLGGSSAINGMIYLRGHPLDYEHWRQLGNPGWGWDDVLPLFRRSLGQDPEGRERGGSDGALSVSDPLLKHGFSRLFVEAGKECGFPERRDFNSGEQDGVGFLQFTIRNGVRSSTYEAFIAPVRGRPNLTVMTEAQVQKVDIESRRATGVTVLHRGQRRSVKARREVILSGGAINSPQLLMVSGVGPGEHLRELGIEVLHDLPGVGQNLHDHVYGSLVYDAPERYSMNLRLRWPRLAAQVAQYAFSRSGVLALGASQTCLFARVLDGVGQPDIQITTRPFSFIIESGDIVLSKTPQVTASVCQLRPESRGALRLRTPQIADAPHMQANYLASPKDQATMMAGLRLGAKVMSSPLLKEFKAVAPLPADDEALLAGMRNYVGAMYHPVGTCRMGPDPAAVVDPQLRVKGIAALRVADASIMPEIISANTNAPTIMIGEKAAEMILAENRAGAPA